MAEFEDLVLTNHLSDVTIYVGPDKHNAWIFPAHQVILCLSSPVFTVMFSGEFTESKKEVVITDIFPHTFYKVLQFIYKGVLEVQSLSETFLIFKAADKYEMEKLKSKCVSSMLQYEITWEIFWDLLTDICGVHDQLLPFELKLKIILFLDKNAHRVLTNENFLFLSRETVSMIVSRSTLVVSELIVCNALLGWAKMQCYRKNILPLSENQRQVLDDLLYTMRLAHIDNKKIFASPIYKILTEEEKGLVMKVPCELSKPWTLNKPIRGDKCRKCILLPSEQFRTDVKSPVYFIFSKHAFVHEMKLTSPYYEYINKINLSALSEQGVQTLIKFGNSTNNVLKLFHVKAFVCYKIEFELTSCTGHWYNNNSSWGFETDGDPAVLFSCQALGDINYKDFLSSEYWKEAFSTRQNPIQDQGTCINEVVATFC